MTVGIIGGGFLGMCLATKLSSQNIQVEIFESQDQLGGLATWENYGDFFWDRFYHVILPNDNYLLSFLEECGLGDSLKWKKTRTGYYVDQQFYSISSSAEFLTFPPLDLLSKIRLAFTIYYGSMLKDWEKLETITSKQWLIKTGGSKNYEKFWKPLLLAKLGEFHDKVSAVFIWSYIKRLFEARENANKEEMGFLKGGYKSVFDKLAQIVENNKGKIHLSTRVDNVELDTTGKIAVHYGGMNRSFDKVVFTGPTTLLKNTVSPKLVEIKNLSDINYLGVVCMVLVTTKPISPYYVLNIADHSIPFTGVIGMSSLVDNEYTGEQYITYFPKYVNASDPILDDEVTDIRKVFMEGFSKLYPGFNSENIVSVHINKARRVQPLQVLNYSKTIPSIETLHEDFYVLNTSQFVNDTLNNNSVAKHVERFLHENLKQFTGAESEFNKAI